MAGFDPNEDPLILSEGADFVQPYLERDITWTEGTTAELSFPGLTGVGPYEAIISPSSTLKVNGQTYTGGVADFFIPRAQTSASTIPSGTRYHLHLTKDGKRYLWFRGKVKRQD